MIKNIIKPKYPNNIFTTRKTSHKDTSDNNIYQIASVSKSFTGMLANLMAQDGKFGNDGLQAKLVDLFDRETNEEGKSIATILKDKGFANITIAQVLNHTSGIGIINYKSIATNIKRSEKIMKGERAMEDTEFLEEELPNKKNHWKQPFGYANEGFFLFQKLVDLMPTTKTFKEEMKEKVLDVYELKNTGFSGDVGDKEIKTYNQIPAGETLISLGAKNTTQQLIKTEATKLLPTGMAIEAAGGLSASMQDLAKFAQQIPQIYSEPTIAKQLYGASYEMPTEDENSKTKTLYSCGIYLDITKKDNKMHVTFRHSGQLYGGFETEMKSSCEYDFAGTIEDFISTMKSGEKQLSYTLLLDETVTKYQQYDGLAKEMLSEGIIGKYHVKLLYETAHQAIKEGKITKTQFEAVIENAKKVSEKGQRYAINIGLSGIKDASGEQKVDTGHLWSKVGKAQNILDKEIFTQFAKTDGVIDSQKLLKIAKNPVAFGDLKYKLKNFLDNQIKPNYQKSTFSSRLKEQKTMDHYGIIKL